MQRWYPAAERIPADDAGPFVAGAPRRGVLHSTESAHYPSYKPGTHPHFTVWLDAAGDVHVAQHVPIDHASSALVHASGHIDTNREGAIQIEVAAFAAHIHDAPRMLLAAVRRLMRWIEAQTGIRRQSGLTFKPYPQSYGGRNGVRMSVAQWKAFHGWCGHMHVPENDHGDPGAIDITYLLSVDPAPQPPAPGPVPAPGPTTEDEMFLIEATGDPNVYVVDAKGKRHIGPDEYHVYVAAGLKKVTVTARQRDAFPNL